MEKIDHDLSERAAAMIGAEVHHCWNNAWRAIQDMPELAGAYYVEGWAVTVGISVGRMGIPIEHGWIELDGKVIDPTEPEGHQVYYAGLRLTREEAERAILEYPPNAMEPELDLPLVWRVGGWGGFDHAGYLQAFQEMQKILSGN